MEKNSGLGQPVGRYIYIVRRQGDPRRREAARRKAQRRIQAQKGRKKGR